MWPSERSCGSRGVPLTRRLPCKRVGCPDDRWNLILRGDPTGDPHWARDCLGLNRDRGIQVVRCQSCDRMHWVHEVNPGGVNGMVFRTLAWCDDRNLPPRGDATHHEIPWPAVELNTSHAHLVASVRGVLLRSSIFQGVGPEAVGDLAKPVLWDGRWLALLQGG